MSQHDTYVQDDTTLLHSVIQYFFSANVSSNLIWHEENGFGFISHIFLFSNEFTNHV